MKTLATTLRINPSQRVLWLASLMLAALYLATPFSAPAGTPPVVANITAAQHASTDPNPKSVDIHYTISDPNFTNVNVFILVSKDSGATWTVPANTFPSGSAV